MYRVSIEPMHGRPEDKTIGDKSGLWKVVVYNEGSGSVVPRNPPKRVYADNVSYDEAFRIADEAENKLNANS